MSGEVDDDEPTVLIDFEHEIMLVRVLDSTFIPSKITISAEVLPTGDLAEEDFDAALTRVRFWLEAIASRCIVFSRANPHALKMLIDEDGKNLSNNLIMLTPAEPTDDHLAALLQGKLTALGSGAIVFGSVELRSNNMAGLSFRFVGNSEEVLPTMAEWIGERSFFDVPWWSRNDASALDVVPAEDAVLSEKPAWAYSLDFLAQAGKPQQDVVLRPEFNPKVIDGGQRDDD